MTQTNYNRTFVFIAITAFCSSYNVFTHVVFFSFLLHFKYFLLMV